MLYRTSTYYKIKQIKKKIKNVQGGQGSSKNISITQILLEKAIEKKRLITVMTDTYPNLKDGAITDFKNQFYESGLDWESAFNKSESNLILGQSIIQFRHISDSRGNTGKSKRRDILYINEANKIGWGVASTYIGRTHEEVYLDYNPDYEFWAHTELSKLKDKDGNSLSEQIIVTYKDNEMLPQSEIDYIESRRDNKAWFRVYGEGQVGTYSDRMIYPFEVVKNIPEDAIRIASGMDFGKSPDPTVLMDCFLKGIDLYLDEVFIENNLMNEKIQGAERMSIVDKIDEIGFDKNQLIIGDSSGAIEIRDIRKHGYHIKAVIKGAGSVYTGMKRLGGYNIKITERSITTISSFNRFLYDVDANDKVIPQPPKMHEPDTIAAVRYVCMGRAWWEYLVPKVSV